MFTGDTDELVLSEEGLDESAGFDGLQETQKTLINTKANIIQILFKTIPPI